MLAKPLNRKEYELNEEAAASYRESLWAKEGEEALEYLKGRGFTSDSINHFGLGFVHEPATGDERMRGRIAFPYWDMRGVSTIRFRHVGNQEGPKFMDRPGARNLIYHVTAVAEGGDTLYVTEGEPDCIIATQMGLPAIALSGAQKWKDHHRSLLNGYSTIRVICDSDDSGVGLELGETVKSALPDTYVQILPAPEGHDLNSAYLEFGPDALKERWDPDESGGD